MRHDFAAAQLPSSHLPMFLLCLSARSFARSLAIGLAALLPTTSAAGGDSAVASGQSNPVLLAQASDVGADRIRTKAAEIKTYQALLKDQDATVRLATSAELIQSKDLLLQQLGFEAAFSSPEGIIRALALKGRMLQVGTLVLSIEPDKEDSEKQKSIYKASGGKLLAVVKKFDVSTGQSELEHAGRGQITGQELMLVLNYPYSCVGRLHLMDGGVLKGDLACTNYAPSEVTLRLN